MNNSEEIKKMLKQSKPFLSEKYKVKEIGVFGSYAREEGVEESDIDILIEFYEPIGWEFFDVKEYLEELLGKKVDLVTVKALKRQLRDKILGEVVYV